MFDVTLLFVHKPFPRAIYHGTTREVVKDVTSRYCSDVKE